MRADRGLVLAEASSTKPRAAHAIRRHSTYVCPWIVRLCFACHSCVPLCSSIYLIPSTVTRTLTITVTITITRRPPSHHSNAELLRCEMQRAQAPPCPHVSPQSRNASDNDNNNDNGIGNGNDLQQLQYRPSIRTRPGHEVLCSHSTFVPARVAAILQR